MELICNELSFYPLSKSIIEVENNFFQFFNTFKAARQKFGFKKIKFQNNLAIQPITEELSFIQVMELIENKDLKRTLITFLQPPYLDDLTENELDEFYKSEYEIVDEDCPFRAVPYGLPIAYIKGTPSISFDSHKFWRSRKINLNRKGIEETESILFPVANICLENDIYSPEIIEWSDTSMINNISSKEILKLYLGFTKYETVFEDNFFEKLIEWKVKDYKIYRYILSLMKDVQLHPFSGGMGQTENLKNRGKEASKRISNSYPDGHRLSYIVEKNIVTFIACKGHYEFH